MDFTSPWEESDVVFLIENQKLFCNRSQLRIWSPVFKAMLSNQAFVEAKADLIPLPGKSIYEMLEFFSVLHIPCTFITLLGSYYNKYHSLEVQKKISLVVPTSPFKKISLQ